MSTTPGGRCGAGLIAAVLLAAASCNDPLSDGLSGPGARIVGAVTQPSGPIAGAEVRIGPGDVSICGAASPPFPGSGSILTNAQGRYELLLLDPQATGLACVRASAIRPSPRDTVVMPGVVVRFGPDVNADSTIINFSFRDIAVLETGRQHLPRRQP